MKKAWEIEDKDIIELLEKIRIDIKEVLEMAELSNNLFTVEKYLDYYVKTDYYTAETFWHSSSAEC